MHSNFNKSVKKVIIIFLLITLTYSNFVLVGSNIMKGLISYANEETETSLKELLITNQEVKTNKIYQINGEEKRVIQIELETGINSNEYPIKETNIILKTNIINKKLEDVKVTSINTNSYTKGTWAVEGEEIKINLINEAEELKEKPEGLDKLLVTYIFQYEEKEEIDYIEKAIKSVGIKTYEKAEASRTFEGGRYEEIELENDILNLTIENKDIHKTTIKEEKVTYQETLKMDTSYRKEVKTFLIEEENDIYKEETKNEEVKIKYLKTIINKEEIINLLGEEGLLTMYNAKTGETLAKITKEQIESLNPEEKTEQKIKEGEEEEEKVRSYITVKENKIEIEYKEEVEKLQIKIENIAKQSENKIESAKIEIQNEKEISNIKNIENIDYLIENIKYKIDEEEKEATSKIIFKDTITKAELEIDNKKWEIGKANKINYTITLNTKENKTDLFIDPIFLIEMPNNVEVNTKNSSFTIENDNGAFTGKKVFVTTVLEKQYIVVILEGKQTEETIANGNTQIKLALELKVEENETQGEAKTKLYYQNSGITAYESGMGFDSAKVDILLVLKNEEQEEITENDTTYSEFYEGDISVDIYNREDEIVKQGEQIEYIVCIYNNKKQKIENLQLRDILPEGITFEDAKEIVEDEEGNSSEKEIEYNYNEEARTLLIDIDKIDGVTEKIVKDEETQEEFTQTTLGYRKFKIITKSNMLTNTTSKEVKNKVEVITKNKNFESNETSNIISDAFLEIEKNNIEEQTELNKEVKFVVKITNKGLMDSERIKYKIASPETIKLIWTEYGFLDENNTEKVKGSSTISNNEYTRDLIEIPAGETLFIRIAGITKLPDGETKNSSGLITIEGEFNSEKINWNTEVIYNPNNEETPETPDIIIKPDDENNAETPSNPEEPGTPETPNTPTNPETPSNPEEPTEPTIPKEEITEGFDLRLKQYLSKITVKNSKGTTTYEYENTNFAKVEIPAKYMNESTVTLEYKIIVENAGTIAGYARKIANYLPEGLNFNTELNPNWYKGEDGNLYSVELMDKLLKSGETEELKIILTKNMTNNNIGTITNTVEIYEASNDENVEDINSIPGDQIEGQNDMSKVEVIIAVATGKIITYILLAITTITIIAVGINKIRKITLKKGGC